MQEISPTNVISVLKQQNKTVNKGKKIHCVQHIENLKALIDRDKIKKITRKKVNAMQTHMYNSHHGIKIDLNNKVV